MSKANENQWAPTPLEILIPPLQGEVRWGWGRNVTRVNCIGERHNASFA